MKEYETYLNYGVSFRRRVVWLHGDLDEETAAGLIRNFQMLDRASSDPIKFFISTYGGEVYEAMAVYDIIRTLHSRVDTFGIGKLMSAGTIIFLAGGMRFLFERTSIMFHSLSDGMNDDLPNLRIQMEEAERLQKMMIKIYRNRTDKKSYKYWESKLKMDHYMDAEKAVQIQFAHAIIKEEG